MKYETMIKRKKSQNITEYMQVLVHVEKSARYECRYDIVTQVNEIISKLIETEEYKTHLKSKMGLV